MLSTLIMITPRHKSFEKYIMTTIMIKCYEFVDHGDQADNEDDVDDEDE